MEFVTQAILIKASDYKENDLLVTLLSPERGKFTAVMRGVKKAKAKLKAFAQPFCLGEYSVAGEGLGVVTACAPVDLFYDLAYRPAAFFRAGLVLEVAEKCTDFGTPAPEFFVLMLRALQALAYSETDADAVAAKFLLETLNLLGYRQTFSACARCGRVPKVAHYDAVAGGVTCEFCGVGRKLKDTTYADCVTLSETDWAGLERAEFDCPEKLVRLFAVGLEKLTDLELKSPDLTDGRSMR